MPGDSADWSEFVSFVKAHACKWSLQPNEGEWGIHHLDDPPHNKLLGPVFARGETSGLVAVDGKVLCQWGDTHRADMTFSVTKTYLALVAGVAVDQGLLPDIDQTVNETLLTAGLQNTGFSDEHNSEVTWRHLLQFTSEWQGECFGVPDQVDRYRSVSMEPVTQVNRKGDARLLAKPGAYWEYNDVRINQFSLALMQLLNRPLPEFFSEFIMTPVGGSDQWRWHGYENSWVNNSDGKPMQSVPGGGHWGGGMVISVHDQLLVAQLMMNNGMHKGRKLVSEAWIKAMRTKCDIAPWYGFFSWLNTDQKISQSASEQSYFAMGIGGQLIWHEPAHQLVVVMRWIDMDHLEQMLSMVKLKLTEKPL